MANTFIINGTVVLTTGNLKSTGILTDTVNLTSSNNIANTMTITSSAWNLLDQGSATNLRYLYMINPNASSSVWVAQVTGSTGTSGSTTSSIAILKPSDTALIPFSGSVVLYARATYNEPSSSYLQYIACQA